MSMARPWISITRPLLRSLRSPNLIQENSIQPSVSNGPCARTKVTKTVIDYEINKTAIPGILQPGLGKIYDKKPFKFKVIKGKSYLWCACGWSKTQPFCDSTHKNPHYKIKMKPVVFIAPETKEYTFCNCKQTSKRPFCDGTHLREDIQAAIKS